MLRFLSTKLLGGGAARRELECLLFLTLDRNVWELGSSRNVFKAKVLLAGWLVLLESYTSKIAHEWERLLLQPRPLISFDLLHMQK